MSDLKLPNVPEGYFWVVESEDPTRFYPRCYVSLKRRTFFGLFSETIASDYFTITRRGLPMYSMDGHNAENAITRLASRIHREYFNGNTNGVANYTGTYYTDM